MRGTLRGIPMILLGLALLSTLMAQESAPAKARQPSFFSGTVITCTTTQVTVNRKGLKNDTTTKTFAIDSATKIEGALKPKVHATVQFVTDEDGAARALRILVRVVR